MPTKPFHEWTKDDVEKAQTTATSDESTTANLAYYRGDHWQGGLAWAGPMPDPSIGADASARFAAMIERIFVAHNIIREAVDRHAHGVTGGGIEWRVVVDEATTGDAKAKPTTAKKAPPAIGGQEEGAKAADEEETPEDARIPQAEAILHAWATARGLDRETTAAMAQRALTGRGALRLFVPSGLVEELGSGAKGLPKLEPEAALLEYLYLDRLEADAGSILLDRNTMRRAAVTKWKHDDEDYIEFQYQEPRGTKGTTAAAGAAPNTIVKTFLPNTETPIDLPLPIGGRLMVFEAVGEPLITEQARQNQKGANFALTSMSRNLETAGFMERIILGAQPPGKFVEDDKLEGGKRFEPAPFVTGPAVTQFLQGVAMTDEDGKVKVSTPSVYSRDPVQVTTFIESHRTFRANILAETKQGHVLAVGDGSASGESRVQMRADYRTMLRSYTPQAEELIRGVLETALRLAGYFSGNPAAFDGLRVAVTVTEDTGPATEGERNTALAAFQARVLSRETTMAILDVSDVDAEAARIADENAKLPISAEQAAVLGLTPQPAQTADLMRRAGWLEPDETALVADDEMAKQDAALAAASRGRTVAPGDAERTPPANDEA